MQMERRPCDFNARYSGASFTKFGLAPARSITSRLIELSRLHNRNNCQRTRQNLCNCTTQSDPIGARRIRILRRHKDLRAGTRLGVAGEEQPLPARLHFTVGVAHTDLAFARELRKSAPRAHVVIERRPFWYKTLPGEFTAPVTRTLGSNSALCTES